MIGVELRPAQALRLWQAVALEQVQSKVPDLTTRQAAILSIIYMEAPPHTVRGLAERLDVTKPVITRALDTMGAMNLVDRHRDPRDRRNMIITRTVDGAQYLDRLAALITSKAKALPR